MQTPVSMSPKGAVLAFVGRLFQDEDPPRPVARSEEAEAPPRPRILSPNRVWLPLPGWGSVVVESPGLVRTFRWLQALWPCLAPEGSLWLWVSPREGHYVKVLADGLLGRSRFQGEIVWAAAPGWLSSRGWPPSHALLLGYAPQPKARLFREDAVDRIPYMAPKLVGEAKARRGKRPTDVWWYTHFTRPGTVQEPPWEFWRRLLAVHTRPGDRVLAVRPPAGLVEAARRLGRLLRVPDAPPSPCHEDAP